MKGKNAEIEMQREGSAEASVTIAINEGSMSLHVKLTEDGAAEPGEEFIREASERARKVIEQEKAKES